MVYSTSQSIEDHIGKTPEEAVTLILSSLPQSSDEYNNLSTDGHNADYGIVYADGSIDLWGYPCHKKFEYVDGSKSPVYTFSKGKRFRGEDGGEFHESALAYTLWILGKDSPWREVLDYPIPDEFRDFDFMYTHGYVFDSRVVPSNLHHQFMVASRMQKEWPWLIQLWFDLVTKHGYTREWAFAYITIWCPYDKDGESSSSQSRWKYRDFFEYSEYNLDRQTMYDFPLDIVNCDEKYVCNFLRRQMTADGRNKPLSESREYTPVNSLWGKNNLPYNAHETYTFQFKERYKDVLIPTQVTKKDSFGYDKTVSVMKISLETLLEIGLKEQERLYAML